MENTNKYIYPIIATFVVFMLGAGYLFFVHGEEESEVKDVKSEKLIDYNQRIEDLAGLELKTDLLDSVTYQSLTDDFRIEVEEVRIGRVNPFRSF